MSDWAKITTTGLVAQTTKPPPAAWLNTFHAARKMHEAGRWALGDLWNMRHHLPDWVEAEIRASALQLKTIQNYAWVASRWPYKLRRPDIDWSHHSILAMVPDEDKAAFLELIKREDMTTEDTRVMVGHKDEQEYERALIRHPLNAFLELMEKARRALDRLPAVPEKVDVDLALQDLIAALRKLAERVKEDKAA